MSTRLRRSSVLEQAEAQTAGVKRNAIKKQMLLGSRKISGELSRVTMGESWSLKRKPPARRHCSAPQEDDTAAQPPPISPPCARKGERHSESALLGSRNAVKRQMFRKVSRSISMMSHSVTPPATTLDESEEAEDSVAAMMPPRSKSTMTNSLQIPSVFERSVSVCEESVNSARKMLEDLFGRRAPPPTPQCSVEVKKSSVISVSMEEQDARPRSRSLGCAEQETRSGRRKMAKLARDTSDVEWIRASSLQTEFESEFSCFESVHDLVAAARSVARTDSVAIDVAARRSRRLRSARLNAFSRSVDVFLLS